MVPKRDLLAQSEYTDHRQGEALPPETSILAISIRVHAAHSENGAKESLLK